MSKEAPTLSLLANSPIRPSLQHLVQNHTLWTAPIIILLFALVVRWSIALNPYSGRFITFITRLLNSLEKKRIQHTTHVWWLRSSETLDGDYVAFTFFKMVYLWFAVVGTWLSPSNSLSQLVMWTDVTNKRNQKGNKRLMTFCRGSKINPAWFALDESKGLESAESKLFMRSTVVLSELLIYIPAVFAFCQTLYGNAYFKKYTATVLILLQPALILIDHGHFQ